jgi:hypothetical protein
MLEQYHAIIRATDLSHLTVRPRVDRHQQFQHDHPDCFHNNLSSYNNHQVCCAAM